MRSSSLVPGLLFFSFPLHLEPLNHWSTPIDWISRSIYRVDPFLGFLSTEYSTLPYPTPPALLFYFSPKYTTSYSPSIHSVFFFLWLPPIVNYVCHSLASTQMRYLILDLFLFSFASSLCFVSCLLWVSIYVMSCCSVSRWTSLSRCPWTTPILVEVYPILSGIYSALPLPPPLPIDVEFRSLSSKVGGVSQTSITPPHLGLQASIRNILKWY